MADNKGTKTAQHSAKQEQHTMAEGKVLKLGSKHNRPATLVASTVRGDSKINEAEAAKLNFFGTADSPKFREERWIPYLETGKDLTHEQAMAAIDRFAKTLDQMFKADHVVVEGANGVVFEGPANRCAAPKDITAAGYVCQLLAESIVLANQQEMNPVLRSRMIEAAKKAGIYKVDSEAKSPRTRTRAVV